MRGLTLFIAASVTVGLLAAGGAANPAAPSSAPIPSPLETSKCDAWEVSYKLVDGTRLKITDTVMKAGDGTYDVGPGKVRLRFTNTDGKPAPGSAELLELEVVTKFTLESKVARVTTDTISKNTPNQCGVVAQGTLNGNKLNWSEQARGYRSDGKLHCEGMMCGKLGAPPKGESVVKMGPYPVTYQSFVFGDGVKKLMMPFSQVAKGKKPKQTTYLQIVGVETSRRCVKKPACK